MCFFFSSRRRHTRSDRDWSSDVCSSDLSKIIRPRILTISLHQKEWTAHVRCKEIVKILGRMIFDGRSFGDASVGHEHIQSLADDRTNFLRQQGYAFWSSQVYPDRIRASAFRADASDNGFRILRGTTVVNQNMRTGVSKRGCDGPPNSPGCTCHQRGLALKCSHHPQPSIRPSSH